MYVYMQNAKILRPTVYAFFSTFIDKLGTSNVTVVLVEYASVPQDM